jgi:hypothetical protein
MMKQDKQWNENDLYRAIGDIDDRFIAEAAEYRRAKTNIPAFYRRAIAVAAALLVVCTALLRILPKHPPSGDSNDDGDTLPPLISLGYEWTATADYRENTAFLTAIGNLTSTLPATTTAPSLYDGQTKIIWMDSGGAYYTLVLEEITAQQKKRMLSMLETISPAKAITAVEDSPPCSVWIALGDGTAVSPYLPYTAGTISYGVLADYAPEYLPAEDLMRLLCTLIEAES